MIAFYTSPGMDARMDEIGDKQARGRAGRGGQGVHPLGGMYWIVVILLLGVVVRSR